MHMKKLFWFATFLNYRFLKQILIFVAYLYKSQQKLKSYLVQKLLLCLRDN